MNTDHKAQYSFSDFTTMHAPFIHIDSSTNHVYVFFQGARRNENQQVWVSSFNGTTMNNLTCVSNDFTDKWFNPVVHVVNGQIWVMLKKGHSPYDWQGYVVISRDFTRWSKPCRLPGNLIGPTKHAPLWLNSDWLLLSSSTEKGPSRITIEKLNVNTGETQLVIINHTAAKITEHFLQPALIKYPNNEIHGYCRSNLANLYHFKSTDNGNSFSSLYKTDIPNPNSAFALLRAINTEGYYMAINPSHQNRKKL